MSSGRTLSGLTGAGGVSALDSDVTMWQLADLEPGVDNMVIGDGTKWITKTLSEINGGVTKTYVDDGDAALQIDIDAKPSKTYVDTADTTLQTHIDAKADKTYVDTQDAALQARFDAGVFPGQVTAGVATSGASAALTLTTKSYVDSVVSGATGGTVSQAYVDNGDASLQTQIDTHTTQINANATSLSSKASTTYVDTQDATLQTNINAKADKTYVDTQTTNLQTNINAKADKTYVDTQDAALQTSINGRANKTYVDSQDTALQTQITANTTAISGKQAANANLTTLSAASPGVDGDLYVGGHARVRDTTNQQGLGIYPPVVVSAGTSTVSGQPYGNGSYTVTVSSSYFADPASVAGAGGGWTSADFKYSGGAGGEYIQFSFPEPIAIQTLTYAPYEFPDQKSAAAFTLYGSNDAQTWTAIKSYSGITYANNGSKTFAINGAPYSSARLVVTQITGASLVYLGGLIFTALQNNALVVAGGIGAQSITVNDASVGGTVTAPAAPTAGTHLANKTYVDAADALLQSNINAKANTTYVDTQDAALQTNINAKADKTYVDVADTTLQTNINAKADKTYVDTQDTTLQTNIDAKADKTYVDAQDTANATAIAGKQAADANLTSLSGTAPQLNHQLYLTHTTSPRITFDNTGSGAPTTTARSPGTKMILWNSIDASHVDWATGMEPNNMWWSVQDSTAGYKWYAGTTPAMTLSGAGNLTVPGANVNLGSTTDVVTVTLGNQAGNPGAILKADPNFAIYMRDSRDGTRDTVAIHSYANFDVWTGGLLASQTRRLNIDTTGLATFYNNVMVTHPTAPNIALGNVGTDPPSLTTRSVGTKVVLWNGVDASHVDYAIGVEPLNVWFSSPDSTAGFKWYAGTTPVGTLSGTGNLTVPGTATAATPTASNHLATKGYVDSIWSSAPIEMFPPRSKSWTNRYGTLGWPTSTALATSVNYRTTTQTYMCKFGASSELLVTTTLNLYGIAGTTAQIQPYIMSSDGITTFGGAVRTFYFNANISRAVTWTDTFNASTITNWSIPASDVATFGVTFITNDTQAAASPNAHVTVTITDQYVGV